MHLETERLQLRPLTIKDKKAFFEYRKDAEANKYQGWIPKNLRDVESFIYKLMPQANRPATWYQLAIIAKETNKLIGDIGIHFLQDNHQVELGYTIAKKHQQKAYATEAVSEVINHLFSHYKKHRITASLHPENIASVKVLEKLGFRKEAHFVESYYQNGKWLDDASYALLSREWTAK